MNNDSAIPTIGRVVGGYLLSAVAAAVTAASILSAAQSGSAGSFAVLVTIGFFYIAFSGLPGFATAIFVARRFRFRHWAFFTVAGGINAILAWMLMGGMKAVVVMSGDMLLLASLVGGLVGGFAYWFAAEYSARGRRAIASE